MGVPAFFKWLCTKYPRVVADVIEEYPQWVNGQREALDTSQPNPNMVEFDSLFLDMNGIIHPASHPEDRPAPRTEDDMFLAICDYLERVFACVRPRKLLFMAIDGVAPRAKMNQQRSRRFKSDQERREARRVEAEVRAEWEAEGRELPPAEDGFDSNVITPGTLFMDRLATHLRAFICLKQTKDAGWRNIRVILTDASVPGEGEHKIMEYIRQQRAQRGYDPNTHHALHGLDADLIMLALATHEPYFTILREYVGKGNREQPKRGAEALEAQLARAQRGEFGEFEETSSDPPPTPFQFLHIHVLREYLHKEFTESRFCPPDQFDFERCVDDFIFLCFLVGNDFLPHVPSLDIREGAIDTLLEVYKGLFRRPGGGYITKGSEVNLERVQMLLEEVAAVEGDLLKRRRDNEQRDEERRKQRQQEVQQRTAEKRHLALLAETAQTPSQIAAAARLNPPKRSRANWEGGPPPVSRLGSSDDQLLVVLTKIKEFADAPACAPDCELPSSLNGYLRRIAHQYCDELELDHPTVGEEPFRRIVLKKRPTDVAEAGPATEAKPVTSAELSGKLKSIMRGKAEIAEPTDNVELGKEGWRERYYEHKLGPNWRDARPSMCQAYVEGLCWVMKYYYDGCASWHWFYPFHYAPFAQDLVESDVSKAEVTFDLGDPFSPFEQLMGVLPPGSAHALPPKLAELMRDTESPLAHIYPTEFETDMDGKRFAWQAVVLLPFIDQDELAAAVRGAQHTLTDEERRRNAVGHTLCFVSIHHPMHGPTAMLQTELRQAVGSKPRRLPLTLKVSRGMAGFICAVPEAPMAGETFKVPRFCGDRAADALQDFITDASFVAYFLPDRLPHLPRLLPGVQLPKPHLTVADQPVFSKFQRPRVDPNAFAGLGTMGPHATSSPQESLPVAPPRPVAAPPAAFRGMAMAQMAGLAVRFGASQPARAPQAPPQMSAHNLPAPAYRPPPPRGPQPPLLGLPQPPPRPQARTSGAMPPGLRRSAVLPPQPCQTPQEGQGLAFSSSGLPGGVPPPQPAHLLAPGLRFAATGRGAIGGIGQPHSSGGGGGVPNSIPPPRNRERSPNIPQPKAASANANQAAAALLRQRLFSNSKPAISDKNFKRA